LVAASEALDDLELPDERQAARNARAPTGQRFRQSSTGLGRRTLGGTTRRPQANAAPERPTPAPAASRNPRRASTEVSEVETVTSVEGEWPANEIAVDDSQLVDWQADNAAASDDDFGDLRGKR
jgi:hypothetical protein